MRLRYLHPPRTGGTWLVDEWGLTEPEYLGHSTPGLRRVDDPPTLTYVTVRNPWDRVVSQWAHQFEPNYGQIVSFEDWVRNGFRVPGISTIDAIDGVPTLAPCVIWSRHADLVIRFEDRSRGLALLCDITGRRYPNPDRIVNASERRPYHGYYTGRAKELVRQMFASDIDAFGYEF